LSIQGAQTKHIITVCAVTHLGHFTDHVKEQVRVSSLPQQKEIPSGAFGTTEMTLQLPREAQLLTDGLHSSAICLARGLNAAAFSSRSPVSECFFRTKDTQFYRQDNIAFSRS